MLTVQIEIIFLLRIQRAREGEREKSEKIVVAILSATLFFSFVISFNSISKKNERPRTLQPAKTRSEGLPMELQMILCRLVVGSSKQNILRKDSEAAFKSLATIFLRGSFEVTPSSSLEQIPSTSFHFFLFSAQSPFLLPTSQSVSLASCFTLVIPFTAEPRIYSILSYSSFLLTFFCFSFLFFFFFSDRRSINPSQK